MPLLMKFVKHKLTPKNRDRKLPSYKIPLPLREGARGRGNLKGELFTLTLSLSRQGRGNNREILYRDLGYTLTT